MNPQPLTKSKYDYPHRQRRLAVHSYFIILFGAIAFMIFIMSCSPKHGCYATKGMRGYGWIKCKETGIVSVLRPDGSVECTYTESK